MNLPKLGSQLYHLGVRTAALLGDSKAKKWVAGRNAIPAELGAIRTKRSAGQLLFWMHAASLGEFEQGKPVFELLRQHHPNAFLVLTFFSPSGYESRKHYETADAVLYLPEDSPAKAKWWVENLQPDLAIFVKYEFWPYHLLALKKAGINTVLIAGAFRSEQAFFRWYGASWRKLLTCFDSLIVQTEVDAALLKTIGLPKEKIFVGGDPRTDRTLELALQPFEDELLEKFTAGHDCMIAGSVWSKDVELFISLRDDWPQGWKLVLAPHQLSDNTLESWSEAFGAERYSEWADSSNTSEPQHSERLADAQVLLLDTIGILSKVYRYGKIAYIGGGFGSGIHNTLEPMAYGLPVIFGPRYQKFPEAAGSLQAGGGFLVHTAEELKGVFEKLRNSHEYARATTAVQQQIKEAAGSAERTYSRLAISLSSHI